MNNPHTAAKMQEMSVSLRHILDLYVAQQNDQAINSIEVLQELDKLAEYAQSTQGGLNDTSLTPYLNTYIEEIAKARALASASSPDIKPAAELINSCLTCHKNL